MVLRRLNVSSLGFTAGLLIQRSRFRLGSFGAGSSLVARWFNLVVTGRLRLQLTLALE